jgi:hypothetical protein
VDLTSNATPCQGTATASSNSITMSIIANLTASVSITSSDADNVICSGNSVTFTATGLNGGTAPTYQWKLNGANVGTNSATYTTTALTNNAVVTCVFYLRSSVYFRFACNFKCHNNYSEYYWPLQQEQQVHVVVPVQLIFLQLVQGQPSTGILQQLQEPYCCLVQTTLQRQVLRLQQLTMHKLQTQQPVVHH